MLRHLTLHGWQIEHDREETWAAYQQVVEGSPESCGCVPCQNWIRARDSVYPTGVRHILEELGIKLGYEAEVYYAANVEGGHLYCGWYNFIGRVEGKPENSASLFIDPFTVCFHEMAPVVHDVFKNRQVSTLEFNVVGPWLLDVPTPM
jgi:hypothetical protein